MSEESNFTPPATAWDLKIFSRASLEEVAAKTVDCSTCPVNMLCEAGEGGTGYVCQECGMTGVWIDEPDPRTPARDVYMIDCGRHRFHTEPSKGKMSKCAYCTGEVMELYIRHDRSRMHYVYTTHAKVAVETRQATFQDSLQYWTDAVAKEKEKRRAAGETD